MKKKRVSLLEKEYKEHLRGNFGLFLILLAGVFFLVGFATGAYYTINQCVDVGIAVMQNIGLDLSEYKPVITDLFNRHQGRIGSLLE